MSSISHFKKTAESVQFKINNKKDAPYEVALINGLRRVILVNLECYCFHRDSINFEINTSIYNEDFLSQRLSLIPLNSKELDKMDTTQIEAHLDESNDSIIEFKNIHARDLKIYMGNPIDGKLLDLEKIITIPDILLLELKPGQKVKCSIKVLKGTHKENGSMFCPVSKALYYFENDEDALKKQLVEILPEKKKDFEILNKERFYLKNSNGVPLIYNFNIECDDIIPIGEIFSRGCDYLINLMKSKITEINDIEHSQLVAIETSPTNMKGYDIVFENSDETLGNIIQTYGLRDKDIAYIAYQIPHPLDKRLLIRISLENKDASIDVYGKKVINILEKVIDILEDLKKDYLSALKK